MLPFEDDFAEIDTLMDSVDPLKIKVQSNTRYLDRQIDITISSLDDATFNALAEAIELFKELYAKELQNIQAKHSSKP